GPDNAFDDDVDEQPIQDLALNAEDCYAFYSDVDEAPIVQTMFMANLSSADPITNEAGPSYDSDILSEVQDHDQYLDDTCAYQEEHVIEEESNKVLTGASEGGNDDVQTGPDPDVQNEGQKETDADTLDEGQAGSNPDERSEGQAGPNRGITGNEEQSIPNHVVHARSDRKHMDLDVTKASPQPSTKQLDEGFLATAYPKIQESLKLAVEEQVLLEEPASSSGTLSSLHHLISPKVHQQFKATTTDTTTTTTTTTIPPPQAQQQSTTEAMMVCIAVCEVVTDTVDWAMQAPLRNRFRDLPEADMKEILHQRMWETESYKTHEDHSLLFEALENSMNRDHFEELAQDLAEAHTGSAHIPTVNLRQDWWKPLEEERVATPEPAWSIPSSDAPVTLNNWASALASNYSSPPEDSLLAQTGRPFEIIKVFHPDVIHLQYQMEECHKLLTDSMDNSIPRNNVSKHLPLGGPPGQVTIQSDFFFNKDLEYLRYGSKGNRPALSISKMKAAYYPDVGLEQMVPDQFWINEECKYDIAAMLFLMYGYDYMKKIVLRRADLNEHIIAERDFKYMYPSDFEDLYLLNLQGHLNHLPPKDKRILSTAVNQWIRQLVIRQRVKDFQLRIESYQTQLDLTKPQWDATSFEYKHDYIVIDSPRAVIFRDKYEVQMMMRLNEIHKFSDGTLQQIDEALDYRVKEFKINRMNLGLNTRFWTRKDVDQCNAFMFAIQRRLRTRRIFRNLESFVGGRVREGDYILLKRTD
nr:integrase, catalytic region, zinc finger, CCHC-type, peptidase aspartic, catalytic [Tanacetum cinerariifolium]